MPSNAKNGTGSRQASERLSLLEAELRRITPKFAELGVEKVILLGSLATGQVGMTSDLDLLIVKTTEKRFLDRLHEFYTALEPEVGMDIAVYTPEEFERMKQTSAFVRQAVREGKVIYEKRTDLGRNPLGPKKAAQGGM